MQFITEIRLGWAKCRSINFQGYALQNGVRNVQHAAQDEGEKLEAALAARQAAEAAAMEGGGGTSPTDSSDLGACAIASSSLYGASPPPGRQVPRPASLTHIGARPPPIRSSPLVTDAGLGVSFS